MDSFGFYLELGFKHISDFAGYDHMLFLVALCAIYKIQQWKKILVLVTAFTIGHSVTLILSAFDIFTIPSNIIEFLIPVTILLTALNNVIDSNLTVKSFKMNKNYTLSFLLLDSMCLSLPICISLYFTK